MKETGGERHMPAKYERLKGRLLEFLLDSFQMKGQNGERVEKARSFFIEQFGEDNCDCDMALDGELVYRFQGGLIERNSVAVAEAMARAQKSTGFLSCGEDLRLFYFRSIRTGDSISFLLLLKRSALLETAPSERALYHLLKRMFEQVTQAEELWRKEQHMRELFRITDRFHAQFDTQSILSGCLKAAVHLFPLCSAEIILSAEQGGVPQANQRLFEYGVEREKTVQSFIAGILTVDPLEESGLVYLNLPIAGRQGVYGILQLTAGAGTLIEEVLEVGERLASTTGSALENANLLAQSHRMNLDLHFINETVYSLSSDIGFEEMVDYLNAQLKRATDAEVVEFIFCQEALPGRGIGQFINWRAEERDMYWNILDSHFKRTSEALFAPDLARASEREMRYASAMAIPIQHHARTIGYAVALSEKPYAFSFDVFKLMRSIVVHAAFALVNSLLQQELQEMVDHDHLTRLYARRYLDEEVARALEQHERGVFLMVDVDNFKRVNDAYGHQIGDDTLMQIADLIRDTTGSVGIGARWGGEEMAMLFPGLDEMQGIAIAQRFVSEVPNRTSPSVTVSCGLTSWNADSAPTYKELFYLADSAMYEAKNTGKNRLCVIKWTKENARR